MENLIKEIYKMISSEKADFKEISKRINDNSENNPKTKNELLNQYSEIHLDILLEKLKKKESLEINLNQDKILSFSYEGKTFKKTKENRIYVQDSLMTIIAEYDNLATFQNTPIIFEVKMGSYGSIYRSLEKKKLRKKIKPIQKAFSKQPILIYAVPKEVFEKYHNSNEKGILNLKEYNGLMIPFHYSKNEFSKELISFIGQNK